MNWKNLLKRVFGFKIPNNFDSLRDSVGYIQRNKLSMLKDKQN